METNEIMRIFYICLALAVFFFLLILLAIFLLGLKGKKQKPDDKMTESNQPIENAEEKQEPIPEQEADDAETRSDESIAEQSAQSEPEAPTEEVRFEIVKKTVVWHTDEIIE